jgi:hypothetical protein
LETGLTTSPIPENLASGNLHSRKLGGKKRAGVLIAAPAAALLLPLPYHPAIITVLIYIVFAHGGDTVKVA